MPRVFIIVIMFLGIATAPAVAEAQTVPQMNSQASSGNGAVGSAPTSSTPTTSSTSSGSQATSPSGTPQQSSTATGSGKGSAGATGSGGAAGSGSGTTSQAPLLLPGEVPETSNQAASSTATAPGSFSPMCPPPVPTTDGGSANLSEIAGMSLGGC
jgi:hypothetical protein